VILATPELAEEDHLRLERRSRFLIDLDEPFGRTVILGIFFFLSYLHFRWKDPSEYVGLNFYKQTSFCER